MVAELGDVGGDQSILPTLPLIWNVIEILSFDFGKDADLGEKVFLDEWPHRLTFL